MSKDKKKPNLAELVIHVQVNQSLHQSLHTVYEAINTIGAKVQENVIKNPVRLSQAPQPKHLCK